MDSRTVSKFGSVSLHVESVKIARKWISHNFQNDITRIIGALGTKKGKKKKTEE